MSHKILHHLTIPGESTEYRTARNKLLIEEMALRRQIESVAALRRALPAGGAVKQDYLFDGDDGPLPMSALFKPGMDTLAIYSFMYGPEKELPCTGCTHFLDGLEGMVQHINQRINLAVVAKSPLPRLLALARARGWRTLPLLSTHGNSYDRDYFGDSSGLPAAVLKQQEFKDGEEWDMPMLNVFQRRGKVISHFWGSELLYVPAEPGQEYRHNDALDSLWNMLDLTPAGRGDFHPQLSYPPINSKEARHAQHA
jgi:predicted dithiol-disulfide oxidoreductase (DUF899 family)